MRTIPVASQRPLLALQQAFFAILISLACGAASAMELQSVDTGEEVELQKLVGHGKWTLVMFWHTNCHVCHMQKPEISAFHDKHKDDDAHVIGIALDGLDGVDLVKKYIAENKPSFPSYVGHDLIIQYNYVAMTEEEFLGTPTYVLFNPAGQVVANKPGMMAIDALENFIARNSKSSESNG